MSIIEKTEKVYSGPEKSVYPQIGTLFAGDSYTKIWDEFGYAYIEYPVTNGVKRGYIEGYAIHGWEDIWSYSGRDIEKVGEAVLEHFKIFLPVPSQDVSSCGETFAGYATEYSNGPGYVARYVHDLHGMDGCLFEFPGIYTSAGQIFDRGLHTRYIQAITNILTTYPR